MFRSLIDMDNSFWRWVGRVPELVVLSLFWYLCSIPVITVIPASCSLFDAISRYTMLDRKGSFRRFFHTFRNELKRGILLSLLWLILFAVAWYGGGIINANASAIPFFQVASILHSFMMILMTACICWLVPLQSRYHNTFAGLHINALRFLLGRLSSTVIMLLTGALVVIVSTIHPVTYCFLLIAPAVIAVFHAIQVEKSFQIAFPNDYVDGILVTSDEERAAALEFSKSKYRETSGE